MTRRLYMDAAGRWRRPARLSIYHAASHTFTKTPAVKIIENHSGKSYLKLVVAQQVQQVAIPMPVPPPLAQPAIDAVS